MSETTSVRPLNLRLPLVMRNYVCYTLGMQFPLVLTAFLLSTHLSYASIGSLRIWSDGSQKKLKTRIAHDTKRIKVRGFDLRISDSKGLRVENGGAAEWVIECGEKNVTARRTDDQAQIQWSPPLTLSAASGIIKVQNQILKDSLSIFFTKKGCDLITEIPFDTLVTAKAAEIDTKGFPDAALDTQIIMERSTLLHAVLKQKEKPDNLYDIDAPTLISLENINEYQEDYRLGTAVKRTAGQVLTLGPDAAPEIFQAFSHPECSGHTITPEAAWGKPIPGYLRSVACPACLTRATPSWKLEMRERELINLMLAGIDHTGVPSQWPADWNRWFVRARLQKIQVKKFDETGRSQILTMSFEFNPESKMDFDITAATFRNWIGVDTLKSTRFSIANTSLHPKNNQFYFEGVGNGHGVGLCQAGAKSLALQGMSSENILKTYFPSAQIRKL